MSRVLYWLPRILGILFAVFISVFALDVFGAGYGFPEVVVALLIHLIPTAVVLLAVVIAWRWEWLGAPLFLGLAALYIASFAHAMEPTVFAAIPAPLALIGLLFLLDWLSSRRRQRAV